MLDCKSTTQVYSVQNIKQNEFMIDWKPPTQFYSILKVIDSMAKTYKQKYKKIEVGKLGNKKIVFLS